MPRHLAAGRQVAEIARADVVSQSTVRSQVKSILCKLDVTSLLAAVGMVHLARWPELLHDDARDHRAVRAEAPVVAAAW